MCMCVCVFLGEELSLGGGLCAEPLAHFSTMWAVIPLHQLRKLKQSRHFRKLHFSTQSLTCAASCQRSPERGEWFGDSSVSWMEADQPAEGLPLAGNEDIVCGFL